MADAIIVGVNALPDALGLTLQIAFGADLTDLDGSSWTYTDVTTDLLHDAGTSVTIGRADNTGQSQTASLSFTLKNPTGNYTPLNPLGTHYPRVVQNTPVQLYMRTEIDSGGDKYVRFFGFINSWNPRTDPTGEVKTVEVTAFGMLGRLDNLKKPLDSPLRRSLDASAPNAYWPMEDPDGSTVAASGLAGGVAMRVASGTVDFGADGPVGAAAAIDFSGGGRLYGPISGFSAPWTASFVWKSTDTADTNTRHLMAINTTDGSTWVIYVSTLGAPGLLRVAPDGTVVTKTWVTANYNDGLWHSWSFLMTNTLGGFIGAQIYADGVLIVTEGDVLTGAGVLFPPRGVNPGQDYAGAAGVTVSHKFAMDHLAFYSALASEPANFGDAFVGFTGESATDRMTRLCTEEGVNLTLAGTSNTMMGPQSVDTLINLLRECEAADHGFLYDGVGIHAAFGPAVLPGLIYRARSDVYNLTSFDVLTIDASANQLLPPFSPFFDRQGINNVVTVTRKGGSSVTVEKTDSQVGTATIGVEDASFTINIDDDDDLTSHANWLLSLGTVEGYRFPTLNPNTREQPTVTNADRILSCVPGMRVKVTHASSVSTDLPPEDIDLIILGWTETTNADDWRLTLNCAPYKPNTVAKVGTARVQTAGTTLAGSMTSTDTSRTMNVTLPWTTKVGDFPLDIMVGGERITVSSITGASSPQTFNFSARHVNGITKSHSSGEAVTVADPAYVGL